MKLIKGSKETIRLCVCPPLTHGSIKPPSVRYCTGGGLMLLNKTACVGYFALGAYRLFLL